MEVAMLPKKLLRSGSLQQWWLFLSSESRKRWKDQWNVTFEFQSGFGVWRFKLKIFPKIFSLKFVRNINMLWNIQQCVLAETQVADGTNFPSFLKVLMNLCVLSSMYFQLRQNVNFIKQLNAIRQSIINT